MESNNKAELTNVSLNISSEINECKKTCIAYDYKAVEADAQTVMEIADCYEFLDWETVSKNCTGSKSFANFRRKKNIKNIEQVNRVQVKLDDAIESIKLLEKSKTKKATIISILFGTIGALIFGGGLSLCLISPLGLLISYIIGISLGVIGAIVCVLAINIFHKILKKDTATIQSLINKKREDINFFCEEGHRYLS